MVDDALDSLNTAFQGVNKICGELTCWKKRRWVVESFESIPLLRLEEETIESYSHAILICCRLHWPSPATT
jgi:hypothetical protein